MTDDQNKLTNILRSNNHIEKINTQQGAMDHILANIDKIYNEFKKEIDKPNIITLSELHKFAPLFCRDTLETMTPDEQYELSDEYRLRVNIQKPVHVVDDNDHGKLLLTLGAVVNSLDIIKHSDSAICSEYAHTLTLDDTNPMVVRDQAIKCMELAKTFSNVQNEDRIRAAISEQDAIAAEFHRKIHGVDIYSGETVVPPKLTEPSDESISDDLFGGFEEIIED